MTRRRRRGRLRLALVVVVIAAAWALLRGPGSPVAGDLESTNAALAPRPAVPDEGVVTPPTVVASIEPSTMPPTLSPATEAALADALEGHLHPAREALASGRLGAACAGLESASAMELPSAMLRERRESLAAALSRELEVAMARLARRVAGGEILAARDELRRLREPTHPRVDEAVAELVQSRGWPRWPPETSRVRVEIVPAASLTAGRAVRLHFKEEWRMGRVVDSRPAVLGGAEEEATVEVQTGSGVAFAFVRRSALEPAATTGDEAVDQSRSALQGGDPVLAALWLGRARSLGAEVGAVAALLEG